VVVPSTCTHACTHAHSHSLTPRPSLPAKIQSLPGLPFVFLPFGFDLSLLLLLIDRYLLRRTTAIDLLPPVSNLFHPKSLHFTPPTS
jgi:hypothetical protein